MSGKKRVVIVDPEQYSSLLQEAISNVHVAKFNLISIAAEDPVNDEKLATISEYYAALWSYKTLLESQLENIAGMISEMVENNFDGLPIPEEIAYQINTFSAAISQLKVLLKSRYNISLEIH